jgi:hypothetical protein
MRAEVARLQVTGDATVFEQVRGDVVAAGNVRDVVVTDGGTLTATTTLVCPHLGAGRSRASAPTCPAAGLHPRHPATGHLGCGGILLEIRQIPQNSRSTGVAWHVNGARDGLRATAYTA